MKLADSLDAATVETHISLLYFDDETARKFKKPIAISLLERRESWPQARLVKTDRSPNEIPELCVSHIKETPVGKET